MGCCKQWLNVIMSIWWATYPKVNLCPHGGAVTRYADSSDPKKVISYLEAMKCSGRPGRPKPKMENQVMQLPDLFLYISQPLFTSVAWTWRRTPRTSCFIPSRAWRPWQGGPAHSCSTGRADRDPGIRQVESTSSAATLWAEANSAPSWLGWTTNCLILQRLMWEWRWDESILSLCPFGVSCFFGSSEALIRSCNLRGEQQSHCSMPYPSLCCHFRFREGSVQHAVIPQMWNCLPQ